MEALSMGDGVVSSFNPMESDVVDCVLEIVAEPSGAIVVVCASDGGAVALLFVTFMIAFASSMGLVMMEEAVVAIVSDGSASNESSGATDPFPACIGVAFVMPLAVDAVMVSSSDAWSNSAGSGESIGASISFEVTFVGLVNDAVALSIVTSSNPSPSAPPVEGGVAVAAMCSSPSQEMPPSPPVAPSSCGSVSPEISSIVASALVGETVGDS